MIKYKDFISSYFPGCHYTKNFDLIFSLISSNNILLDIFNTYVDNKTKNNLIFSKRYQIGINKILIYIPLNDNIGIYACMRYLIEQLLKFIYSIYINETIEKINTTGFRIIKDNLLKQENYPFDKNIIEQLISYYVKYSNNIHEKNIILQDTFPYLTSLLTQPNKFLEEVYNDLNSILDDCYLIYIKQFNIYYNRFSTDERLRLDKCFGSSKRKKIYNLLNMKK